MTIKNRWIDKKHGKPTQVVAVQRMGQLYANEKGMQECLFSVTIVQEVFSMQKGVGIHSRRYVYATDELDAWAKAKRGEFDNY